MSGYYNFKEINENVPIEEVLALHGIYPNSKGKYQLRENDDTASASINKNKIGNAIHDFGDNNTFNPISLTAYLRKIDYKEAAKILAEEFGFSKEQNDSERLSEWEWARINIASDLVTKNIDFQIDKYGLEKTSEYSQKWGIPVSHLNKNDDDHLRVYEKILRSRAIPYAAELKNKYYRTLYDAFHIDKLFGQQIEGYILDAEKTLENNKDDFQKLADELNSVESILKKAIKGTSIKYKPTKHNFEKDFYELVNGEISFEIGRDSYYDIKNAAYQDKVKVFYCLVSSDEYYKLTNSGLNEIRNAAFRKGDEINLAFLSIDSNRVNYLVRSLRAKEQDIGKKISEVAPEVDLQNSKEDTVKTAQNNRVRSVPTEHIIKPNGNKTIMDKP